MPLSFNLDRLRKDRADEEVINILDVETPAGDEVVVETEDKTDDGLLVLSTDNLVKKYGKRTVVNHVSINVTQGEIVGLLGPNGAG